VFMRVSVVPTLFGESVVIRVFDPAAVALDLNKVGMDPQTLHQFRQLIHKPGGMILVTGPTGAGKTTTLYSTLNELNEITKKIITAEDPVEFEIDGIVQCPMRQDLTFADTLRTILGQNPNVVVVGAIRDQEEVQITMQAALGGRKVLSTLNANDAASSITQLCSMGLEPSLLVAAVKGILAQRLVRVICAHCKHEVTYPEEYLTQSGLKPQEWRDITFYEGAGCFECGGTGFRGRSAIHELLDLSEQIRELILNKRPTSEIRRMARDEGMTFLRESALEKARTGVTTLKEINKVTFIEG